MEQLIGLLTVLGKYMLPWSLGVLALVLFINVALAVLTVYHKRDIDSFELQIGKYTSFKVKYK